MTSNSIPIIMCTWMRVRGFAKVLESLREQTEVDVDLHVWNNNAALAREFETAARLAHVDVDFHHSPENIGGFGRFYFARELRKKTGAEYCIFLDDDLEFDGQALASLASEAAPYRICSQYGWVFNSPFYYDRHQPSAGEGIDYAGTGGMVADTRVFDMDALYGCPEKYWYIEDLWLSFFARTYAGYELVQSAAKMKHVNDEFATSGLVMNEKVEMLAAIVENFKYRIGGDKKNERNKKTHE